MLILHTPWLFWRQMLVFLLLTGLIAAPAAADPVGRVGRIALVAGSVQVHRAENGESTPALVNWPLTSGDVVTTAPGGRAELQIGAVTVRVDANTVLEVVQLDDQRIYLRLPGGSVIAHLPLPDSAREFELATRDGAFTVGSAGFFRVDSGPVSTVGTAYSGRLHFAAPDSALDVDTGQRVEFWSAGGRTHYHPSTPAQDEFAYWSSERDRQYRSGSPTRYVSPEMTGAADLDAYGRWSDTAEYGAVWFPRLAVADWAPYRFGRWAWVEPWGWTWVGEEPWGFAPFHYGRWVYYRDSWGWVPGRRVDRPVYAPALVAWVGTSGNGLAVRGGSQPSVGWFPLAPREPYVPAYRASEHHIYQLNTAHIARNVDLSAITRNPQDFVERTHYAHRDLSQAVTVVPGEVLGRRRSMAEYMVPRTTLGDAARGQSVLFRPAVEPPRHEAAHRPEEGEPRRPDDRGVARQPVTPSAGPGARNPFAVPAGAVSSASTANAVVRSAPGSITSNRDSGSPNAGRYAPEPAASVGRSTGSRPPFAPRDPEPSLPSSERVDSRTPANRHWPSRTENSVESRGSTSVVPATAIREPSEAPRPPASISGTPGVAPFSRRPPAEVVAPTRVERSTAERLPPPPPAARQERTEGSVRDNNVRREEPASRPFRREPLPAPAASVPAPRVSAPAPRSEAPPSERPSRPERPHDAARLFEHRPE